MFSANPNKRIKIEAASASLVEGHHHEDFEPETTVGKLTASGSGQAPVAYKIISPTTANSVSGMASGSSAAAAVLTTPMSGQFYVIGNPADVTSASTAGGRVIAPKTLTISGGSTWTTVASEVNNTSSNNSSSNSSRRIDRRRATHNEVERRRRDTINAWIMQLGKLIPGLDMDQDQEKGPPKGGGGGALSKGSVLAKACDYVSELTEDNKILEKRVRDLENVSDENERLLATIEELQSENAILKQQLENHGLPSTSNMDDILS